MMPQAQGDLIPAPRLLPNHGVDLECPESDSDLFEEGQGTIDLPLSQGSTLSTFSDCSSNSDPQPKNELDYLMDAVQHEHSKLSNETKRSQCSTSHTENMAARLNPVTPTKPHSEADVDPLTPTANMKLLMSAVSPEIRNREKEQKQAEKKEVGIPTETNNNYMVAVPQKGTKRKAGQTVEEIDEDIQATGRKEKSLGLLCQRYYLKLFDVSCYQDDNLIVYCPVNPIILMARLDV